MRGDLRQAKAKTLMWSLDGTLRYLPLAAGAFAWQLLMKRQDGRRGTYWVCYWGR